MIARFTALMPFAIYVPDVPFAEFALSTNSGEYEVVYWPPAQGMTTLSAIESDPEIPLTSIPGLLCPKEPQTASELVVVDGRGQLRRT